MEPGLLPPQGILFVGGEPKVGKSLLVANLTVSLAAGADRIGFSIPAARRVLICQFEPPVPQFVSRLALMHRAGSGAAADQHLRVDTRHHVRVANSGSAPPGVFISDRAGFTVSILHCTWSRYTGSQMIGQMIAPAGADFVAGLLSARVQKNTISDDRFSMRGVLSPDLCAPAACGMTAEA